MVEVLKEELEEGRWASFNLLAHLEEGKKLLTYFLSFSLDLIEDLEDYEWRDTIQLYKEEVRNKQK